MKQPTVQHPPGHNNQEKPAAAAVAPAAALLPDGWLWLRRTPKHTGRCDAEIFSSKTRLKTLLVPKAVAALLVRYLLLGPEYKYSLC